MITTLIILSALGIFALGFIAGFAVATANAAKNGGNIMIGSKIEIQE